MAAPHNHDCSGCNATWRCDSDDCAPTDPCSGADCKPCATCGGSGVTHDGDHTCPACHVLRREDRIDRSQPCKRCDGVGYLSADEAWDECPACHGGEEEP